MLQLSTCDRSFGMVTREQDLYAAKGVLVQGMLVRISSPMGRTFRASML